MAFGYVDESRELLICITRLNDLHSSNNSDDCRYTNSSHPVKSRSSSLSSVVGEHLAIQVSCDLSDYNF